MKASDGPFVPESLCCHCRVPVLRSQDNFFSGWGWTYCMKCRRHYAWGMLWQKFAQNMPRKKFLQEFA